MIRAIVLVQTEFYREGVVSPTLAAAFPAAEAGTRVTSAHALLAVRREYETVDRTTGELEP